MTPDQQRRREYWKRRSIVRRMSQEGGGSGLDTTRMQDKALWSHLEQSLTLLCTHHAMQADPTMFGHALRAWDCYGELMTRGIQLALLPPEFGAAEPDNPYGTYGD